MEHSHPHHHKTKEVPKIEGAPNNVRDTISIEKESEMRHSLSESSLQDKVPKGV
jgi:hypothetical protein